MRRIGWVVAIFIFQGVRAAAQDTLDVFEQNLKQIKQEHDQATAQVLDDFLSQLDTASASPEAALELYQKAGGPMPDSAPVHTEYEHETPDEKADRLAQDAANLANLTYVAQLHCGMMRFGALFVTKPRTKGLHDDWIAWLKNGVQIYLQIKTNNAPTTDADGHVHGGGPRKDTLAADFENKSLQDSIISGYLGFHGWGDGAQGGWAVKDLPKLYRAEVLDPLREHPTADTLAAWDVYISLENADETDPDRWAQIDYPSLAFDRACDDYAANPSMEKLQAVGEIVSNAGRTHPQLMEMIARADELVKDYRSRHPGEGSSNAPPPPAPVPAGGPAVSVTTTTEGDMTIITTHTNSAPVAPNP